jgi:hypothetical protein
LLLPLLQNNLLVSPSVTYTGNVQIRTSVDAVFQLGSNFLYVGSVALSSSIAAQTSVSYAYIGSVQLVIAGTGTTQSTYAYTGAVAVVLGGQARTFTTPTYTGNVALVISVNSVPPGSNDWLYAGHIALEIFVLADVQVLQQDIDNEPPHILASPKLGSGVRQLIAIPH